MVEAPLVAAIVGPTGAGKSAMAMAVAGEMGAEIAAVDAFTIYRGMDIGTAKPTPHERATVDHHLVDVLHPSQPCSVEWFQTTARSAIDDVLGRGRTPLLVGGSGLYFRAVVDALEFPPTDPAVRARIADRYADEPGRAHRDLAAVDPAAAAKIDPANVRRAVRALEVWELTGRRFSDWRRAWDSYESIYPGLRVVGVDADRAELASLLDARVDAMIAAGWVDECRELATVDLSATARQAIGYAELLAYLAGEVDLATAVDRIRVRTRRYAARQRRWFAADPRVQWSPPDDAPQLLRTLCTL